MKSIKLGHYHVSYFRQLHKVNYRYDVAWNGQPLIHMGDILDDIRQVRKVELFIRPVSSLPPISSNRIGLILE